MPQTKVLLAGESWMSHTIHVKGFDSFTTSEYAEGASWLIEGLEAAGHGAQPQTAGEAGRGGDGAERMRVGLGHGGHFRTGRAVWHALAARPPA